MGAGLSWVCPACGRRVPPNVAVCRCGRTRDASEHSGAASHPAPTPAAGRRPIAALAAAASVGGLTVAIAIWTATSRRTPTAQTQAAKPAAAAQTAVPAPAAAPIDRNTEPLPPTPIPAAAVDVPAATERTPALEDVISAALPALVRVEAGNAFGTGFFVKPDTILTNVHVVSGNVSVTIRRSNGQTIPARVERSAPDLDVAVIRIDTPVEGQPTIALGSGLRARPGQEVFALGSPLGLQNTVTRGIVSAVRQVGAVTLIQTDAAINPGNSGGPLLDRGGTAIGIATMGMRSSVAQGLSFAVAIDHASALLEGRQSAPGSGTPLTGLTQAMRDGRPAPSESETLRTDASNGYERAIAQVARRADALDERWRSFKSGCYEGRIAGSFDHEWFALWEPRAMQGAVSPGCGVAFTDVRRAADDIRSRVLALDEAARQAGVFPGTRRDVLRRYRLDYSGWDR